MASTQQKIKQTEQRIATMENRLAREKLKARKAETRQKIEWGGLVKKSTLHRYSKAVILGALLDSVEKLEKEEGLKAYFQSKGDAAFMGHKEKM